MVRPRLCRRVCHSPSHTFFKPAGRRANELDEVILAVDELEAIRLKDYKNLDQEQSSKEMGISQPTFYRLLSAARKKIAEALIEGKAIRVQGGDFKLRQRCTCTDNKSGSPCIKQ